MEHSRNDDSLLYRLEPLGKHIEEKAGRHIDDFLVTGPEQNVEPCLKQAIDKLNMHDAVRLYKTGDEARLLVMNSRNLEKGYSLQRTPLLIQGIAMAPPPLLKSCSEQVRCFLCTIRASRSHCSLALPPNSSSCLEALTQSTIESKNYQIDHFSRKRALHEMVRNSPAPTASKQLRQLSGGSSGYRPRWTHRPRMAESPSTHTLSPSLHFHKYCQFTKDQDVINWIGMPRNTTSVHHKNCQLHTSTIPHSCKTREIPPTWTCKRNAEK